MNTDRLSELLDLARTKRIGVWGDAFEDAWCDISEVHVNPEADTPTLRMAETEQRIYPGGADNVQRQLQMVVAGRELWCSDSFMPWQSYGNEKIRKTRYVKDGRILCRIDHERPQQPLVPKPDGEDAWVISDYHKGTVHPISANQHANQVAHVPVVWDCKRIVECNPENKNFVLKMNVPDAKAAIGEHGFIRTAIKSRLRVVITRGPYWPLIMLPDGNYLDCGRTERDVSVPHPFQPSGAGDAFSGFLALFMACGADLVEAAGYAHLAAAAAGSTGHFRAPVLRSEILGMLDPSYRKLLEGEDLALWLRHRCTGRLVVTNGVFDLLHPGHVRLLERCRQIGEHVLVLVNTCTSAAAVKGRRPKMPLDDRLDMLAALGCVDVAVPFSDATPAGLLKSISDTLDRKIDVLVKGEDSPDLPGAEFCEHVELVPCQGEHTSDIIARVASRP